MSTITSCNVDSAFKAVKRDTSSKQNVKGVPVVNKKGYTKGLGFETEPPVKNFF